MFMWLWIGMEMSVLSRLSFPLRRIILLTVSLFEKINTPGWKTSTLLVTSAWYIIQNKETYSRREMFSQLKANKRNRQSLYLSLEDTTLLFFSLSVSSSYLQIIFVFTGSTLCVYRHICILDFKTVERYIIKLKSLPLFCCCNTSILYLRLAGTWRKHIPCLQGSIIQNIRPGNLGAL